MPSDALSALSMQLAQEAVRARGRVLPWPHLAAEPVKGARIGVEEVDIEDLRRGAIEGHQMSSEAIRWQSDGNQMAIRWQSAHRFGEGQIVALKVVIQAGARGAEVRDASGDRGARAYEHDDLMRDAIRGHQRQAAPSTRTS